MAIKDLGPKDMEMTCEMSRSWSLADAESSGELHTVKVCLGSCRPPHESCAGI